MGSSYYTETRLYLEFFSVQKKLMDPSIITPTFKLKPIKTIRSGIKTVQGTKLYFRAKKVAPEDVLGPPNIEWRADTFPTQLFGLRQELEFSK